MLKVEKRDGTIVDFAIAKIVNAIQKAFDSCKMAYDPQIFDLLVLRVSADVQPKIKNDIVSVEDIQDSVERVLSQAGYTEVAKAYILYRKQRENIRRIENTTLDYKNIVDAYLDDVEQEQLQDQPSLYSVGGLILSNSGAITRNYWLSEVYDASIKEAHNNGLIHIHDLDMLTGDSASWSLLTLIRQGITGMPGQVHSKAPKHLMTLCNQMVNVLGILQNEWAGAQSFSSFDTYLAPYVKKEKLSLSDVKKALEAFIYGVNIPSRWGTKTPFSNVLFDMQVPQALKDTKAWVGNEQMDFTYGQCQKEMHIIQEAFFSILLKGDAKQNGFPFPIVTVLLDKNFDFDEKSYTNLFLCAGKYGMPYFVNASMVQRDPNRPLDQKQWNYKPGFYSYPENSGSIGTVTINLVRLAWLAEDETDFFRSLDEVLALSCRSLQIKRQVLTKLFRSGLYPYTACYIDSFEHHFSTIGIVGMNEAGINAKWLQKDMGHKSTQEFARKVLSYIRDVLMKQQESTHCLYNLEATPAESVSYRFAKRDQDLYPDMKTAGIVSYTNSSQMPLENEEDLFSSLQIQETIQSLYNGGVSFSIPMAKGMEDTIAVKTLVQSIIKHFSIYDFMLSPVYSICPDHGYISGLVKQCPQCDQECTVWARMAGYYHPVNFQNDKVRQDFFRQHPYILE